TGCWEEGQLANNERTRRFEVRQPLEAAECRSTSDSICRMAPKTAGSDRDPYRLLAELAVFASISGACTLSSRPRSRACQHGCECIPFYFRDYCHGHGDQPNRNKCRSCVGWPGCGRSDCWIRC